MHPLQKQFHHFIRDHRLITEGDNVLLAVSGGVDSMVMLELFKHADVRFAVAHCNFGLRGSASDGDEAFVVAWAKNHGIPCHVKHIDLMGASIQLTAREKRYEWFRELMREKGYTKLATAHHLNDSLETTLLNLVRGTGLPGLKGIPVTHATIIRPLLFASKRQLVDFAKEVGLEWREDFSNQKTDYNRNKVRKEVVPKLEELNPSLLDTHRDTKERISLSADFIAKKAGEVMKLHFDIKRRELALNWLTDPSDLILLNELLSAYGFNYRTVKEIHQAIGKPGKRFESATHHVIMDRSSLFIQEGKKEEPSNDFTITDEGRYSFRQQHWIVEYVREEMQSLDQGDNIACLDAASVRFPITIRTWKKGDAFVPLGMKGNKKVSDFLIDQKVPVALKEEVLVVEMGGEIAWLVGYRISAHFKVRNKQKVFWIVVEDS